MRFLAGFFFLFWEFFFQDSYTCSISFLESWEVLRPTSKTVGFDTCYTMCFFPTLWSPLLLTEDIWERETFFFMYHMWIQWKNTHPTPFQNSQRWSQPWQDATILGKLPGGLRNGSLIEVDGLTVTQWMIRVTFFKQDLSNREKHIILEGISKHKNTPKRCPSTFFFYRGSMFQVDFLNHLGMIFKGWCVYNFAHFKGNPCTTISIVASSKVDLGALVWLQNKSFYEGSVVHTPED